MNNRKEICDQIAKDAENDATNMDGQPFTGKTIATYFGYHGASIATLANLIKSVLEDNELLRQEIENLRPIKS